MHNNQIVVFRYPTIYKNQFHRGVHLLLCGCLCTIIEHKTIDWLNEFD